MAYQTLYRKYRPKTFELVYGQDVIVKTLTNIIKNNKLTHAYLFTGPRGTGKTSCAKLFAKTINCINNSCGDACNECENCISFNQNSNPDIIEIDAASNNGVDEIREIKNKVNLVPSMSKYKVYIIDEVHMLSIGAFNALLKTLEEPPEYIIFILATTEPQKLPATIISRCQRFDFKDIAPEKMKQCLKNIVEKENIKIKEEALDAIVASSNGGMRDAIGTLNQAYSFSDEEIEKKDVEELIGTVSDEKILLFLNKMKQGIFEDVLTEINDWCLNGKDIIIITQKIIKFFEKEIINKKINNVNKNGFSENISDEILYNCLNEFLNLYNRLQSGHFKRETFEINIIQIIDNYFIEKNKKEISKEKNNVSRETLPNKEMENEVEQKIKELKDIRINNILLKSSKKEMEFIESLWNNINDYLIDEKNKVCAGILIDSKPVACSNEGIIVAIPNETSLERIEKEYDISKKIFNEIYNKNYKIVYITDSYWKSIRPDYVMKVKNGQLEYKDELYVLSQIKKINNEKSINEFDELIVVEE